MLWWRPKSPLLLLKEDGSYLKKSSPQRNAEGLFFSKGETPGLFHEDHTPRRYEASCFQTTEIYPTRYPRSIPSDRVPRGLWFVHQCGDRLSKKVVYYQANRRGSDRVQGNDGPAGDRDA